MRGAPLDAARTIACALVVLAHVDILMRAGVESWWPGGTAIVPVLGTAVPTFFILSGLSFPRWGAGSRAGPYARRKLRQLVVPFLVWNVVTLLLMPVERTPLWYGGFNLLTGAWHLYFIFALLQLMALAWFAERHLRLGGEAMLLIAGAITGAMYLWSDALLWSQGGDGLAFEATIRKFGPTWGLFFAVGLWLRDRPQLPGELAGRIWFWAAAAAAYAGYYLALRAEVEWLGYATRLQFLAGGLAFQVLGPLALIGALQRLQAIGSGRRVVGALARGSRHTFAVYLAHAPVLLLLAYGLAWAQAPLAAVWLAPALWIAAGGGALLLGLAGGRAGSGSWVLFGVRR